MRLVRFTAERKTARPGLAVPDEDIIIDVQQVGAELDIGIPTSVRQLLEGPRWAEKLELISAHALDANVGLFDRDSVRIAAPIVHPRKIICVGLNYVEHIKESDEDPPDNPILFSKYPSAIVGPNEHIEWDPDLTSEVDYEVELAAIIGTHARRVDEQEARGCIAGYTVANDVSARDLQFADEQWVRGKSLDTFCPLGPEIVTEDELGDPEELDLWAELNGERLQESSTTNLIFGLDELVSFCSDAFTLTPGDVILTGTPTGVGVFRDPPVLLEEGDEITVGVEGVGELSNPCRYS